MTYDEDALKGILDTPILLCEESSYCFTDVEAARSYYKDMYREERNLSDPAQADEFKRICSFLNRQSLEDFANPAKYKDFGFNTYIRSLRDVVGDAFSKASSYIDLRNDIWYDAEEEAIVVDCSGLSEDAVDECVELLDDSDVFGTDSCVGRDIGYAPYERKVYITANFEFLNEGF